MTTTIEKAATRIRQPHEMDEERPDMGDADPAVFEALQKLFVGTDYDTRCKFEAWAEWLRFNAAPDSDREESDRRWKERRAREEAERIAVMTPEGREAEEWRRARIEEAEALHRKFSKPVGSVKLALKTPRPTRAKFMTEIAKHLPAEQHEEAWAYLCDWVANGDNESETHTWSYDDKKAKWTKVRV